MGPGCDALLGILVVIGMLFAGGLVDLSDHRIGRRSTRRLAGQALLEVALVATAYWFAVRRGATQAVRTRSGCAARGRAG